MKRSFKKQLGFSWGGFFRRIGPHASFKSFNSATVSEMLQLTDDFQFQTRYSPSTKPQAARP